MRKIFIFFTIVLSFLFLSIIKVDGMTIPNASKVKFYNLEWVYRGQGSTSDELIYDLLVEIEPDEYEPLTAVINYEMEVLEENGVVVFNFPRSKSTLTDTKQIIYRRMPNSEQQVFGYVDINYIAVHKMNPDLGGLYIDFDGSTHILDYNTGYSTFEIIRFQYYIPDYTLNDAYNNGYTDGYIDGKAAADELKFEQGYIVGYDEGFYDGYDSGNIDGYGEGFEIGRSQGYDEGYYDGINTLDDYMQGYEDGFKAGEKSKIAQNNEAFYNSIEKWLVPAIITVIILGGIVSIIAIKRREQ